MHQAALRSRLPPDIPAHRECFLRFRCARHLRIDPPSYKETHMFVAFSIALTALFAVAIFVIGQIIVKFFIEPIHEQSELFGEITFSLVFYAPHLSAGPIFKTEYLEEASMVLRQQASQLYTNTNAIPWYPIWRFLRLVPDRANVVRVSHNLIGLSNSLYDPDPLVVAQRTQEIVDLLNIHINFD